MDQRTFVGEVDGGGKARLWLFDGAGERRAVPHVARHSADGLSWGYAGKGPADAAFSLLSAATGNPDAAEQLHQAFLADVVARLPLGERFALPAAEVESWLAEHGAVAPTRQRVPARQSDAEPPPTAPNGVEPDLAARARALDDRERELHGRELRLDAMAAAVGIVVVEPADALPARAVREQLEALVVDSGEDLASVARGLGLDPKLARAVASGGLASLDLAQVRQVCEALRCTPYDLWGAEARAIAHAYGPDQWPADAVPLLPVAGAEAAPMALSRDWPAPAPSLAGAALRPEPAALEMGP